MYFAFVVSQRGEHRRPRCRSGVHHVTIRKPSANRSKHEAAPLPRRGKSDPGARGERQCLKQQLPVFLCSANTIVNNKISESNGSTKTGECLNAPLACGSGGARPKLPRLSPSSWGRWGGTMIRGLQCVRGACAACGLEGGRVPGFGNVTQYPPLRVAVPEAMLSG
jgi:hypothetical protein